MLLNISLLHVLGNDATPLRSTKRKQKLEFGKSKRLVSTIIFLYKLVITSSISYSLWLYNPCHNFMVHYNIAGFWHNSNKKAINWANS